MTVPPSGSGEDDLIAQFMRELQESADPNGVVEKFCTLHPDRAADFRSTAAAHLRMNAVAPEPTEPAPRLSTGDVLGDFRIIRFLKRGGMGEIYEAEQVCLSRRRVALKVIRTGHVSPTAQARFLREQDVLAKLHQTHIVPVFAAGEKDDLQYFAMQYIDGATLGHVVQILRTQGPQTDGSKTPGLGKLVESVAGSNPPTAGPGGPPVLTGEYYRSVAASLADVADALDAAHRANVLHRDVKPSNLMAERSGKCWVIDFGLAGLSGDAAPSAGASTERPDAELTTAGDLMGTPAYMAPEQFDGRADRASEVWSLGVTLYEMLALRRPFDGPLRDDFRRQTKEVEPPRLRKVPRDLEAICQKAMQKHAHDRYPTAGAFAADLRRWLRHEPTAANPPLPIRRFALWARRKPGWAATSSVAVLALIAVTGLILRVEQIRTRAAQRDVHQRDRQLSLLALQKEHLSPHTVGWRDRLWQTGATLAADGPDPDLRDRMAAILSGLDAKPSADLHEGSATFLAYDPTGKRLLMGGYECRDETAENDRSEPTRVRNLTTGEVRTSTQSAVGPVGWRGDVPVQLIPPTQGRQTYLLWNVDFNTPVEEFALPTNHDPKLADNIEGMNIAGVVMSADAKSVAALARGPNNERLILLWKAGERLPWKTIPNPGKEESGHTDALALSADGSLLALGTLDGQVAVWSLAAVESKPPISFELGRSPITALTFGRHRYYPDPSRLKPDGIPNWQLGVGDAGGTVAVWDLGLRDRTMLSRVSRHEVFALAFCPDGVSLFSTGRSEIRCCDVNSEREQMCIFPEESPPGRNWLPGIASTPDGKQFAVTSIPRFSLAGGVDLFDLETGKGIQALRGIMGQVRRVTITADGKRAAGLTQNWQVGVWEVSTGELLLRVDAPLAEYAEHADLRLTEDGKYLILAGGREAHRWEIPNRPNAPARKTDTWKLNPSYSNRLGITAEGKILLCRNETKSGAVLKSTPSDHMTNPRCARIYELQLGETTREIVRHDDHAWHVFCIHAIPDGSYFIVDGIKTKEINSRAIVAYEGDGNKRLWYIPFPNALHEGNSQIDSTGQVLKYFDGTTSHLQRSLPYSVRGKPDTPVSINEYPALGHKTVFLFHGNNKIQLAVPGMDSPYLGITPDEPPTFIIPQFTPDGRFLVWGVDNGTVLVSEMERVRKALKSVKLGW